MPVFDIEAYNERVRSLKTKYNIPDEDLNLKDLDEVKGGFLRQDEFSRKMQNYNTRESELNAKFAVLEPFEKFLRTLETDYQWGPREQWTAEQVSFARQNQGDANHQPAGLNEQAVSKIVADALAEQDRKYGQLLENTQRGAALLIDFIPEAREEWRDVYGKYGKFPKAEFEQFISPGDPAHGVQPGKGYNVPLTAAWEMFKTPYEVKRQTEDWEQKLKDADEAGYRRGSSRGPGSLEPFADETMSASLIADRQNALPEKDRRPEPSEAEKRSRFTTSFDNAIRSGGNAPTQSVPTSVPAPSTAPVTKQ